MFIGMAQQSKNKVKIEKKYENVGRLPRSSMSTIKQLFGLERGVFSIKVAIENALKHNSKHFGEIAVELANLGLTPADYIRFITNSFNRIAVGNVPMSLVLLVDNGADLGHMAAIHLHFEKNSRFWLVTSVHSMRPSDIAKLDTIWRQ